MSFCETYPFLKTLCDLPGVSGDERLVACAIAEHIHPYCDSLRLDKVGNLIAFKKGTMPTEKPVLYCAHLDEVGLMIRHIGEDGTLLFEQVGMLAETLPGKRVLVGKDRLPGVICSKPVHLNKNDSKTLSTDAMYIDIGCTNAKQAEDLGVFASYACFDNDFTVFGEGLVRSKALDDRFGCFVLCEMTKCIPVYDSYFVFMVGEELGHVGAVSAVREIDPMIAYVFEATTASDIPSNTGAARVCELGRGAVVPFMDGATLYDRALYKDIRMLAEKHGIPTQTKSRIAGGTDAAAIQRALCGIRVAAISLPCRYIHTASCVASEKDMEACLDLGKKIINNR